MKLENWIMKYLIKELTFQKAGINSKLASSTELVKILQVRQCQLC